MSKQKSVGPVIKVDGEKEYKKSLSNINSSMKLLVSEMRKSTQEFSSNNKSLKALKEQTQQTTEKVELQKQKVATLKEALENSKKLYGENSEKTKQWQISLNNAETELNKTEKELKALTKQTSGIGKLKTSFADLKQKIEGLKGKLSPVADGLKKVASAGAKVAKLTFKATAAAVGAIGTAAVAAAKKIWDLSKEAAEAGDTIDKQSQKMQMSAESYQQLAYAAKLSGTNMATMQKAQKALSASGSNLPLIDALKQCAGSADVAAAATEMFGAKTAQELLPMLNQGSDGIDTMLNNAKKYGQVMSNDAVKASARFKDSLSTLSGTFKTLKNNIVAEMMPGLTTVMDGFTGLLTGVDGSKEKIIDGVKSITESFKSVSTQITNIIGPLFMAIGEIAPTIITSLVQGIIDNLDPILDAAISIVEALVNSLLDKNNLQKIIKSAVDFVITLTEGLVNNLDTLIDGAFVVVDSLISALLEEDNLQKLIQTSIEFVTKITTGLIEHTPQLISAGLQLVKGLVKGLWDNRQLIIDSIKKLGKKIIESIKNTLGIHSPSTIFAGIGKNLIQGLINGIQDAKQWVIDKIRGLGNSIIETAKNILGIHSPSTVFAELGSYTGEGYGNGFVKSMATVRKRMQEAIPTTLNSDIGVRLKSSVQRFTDDINNSPVTTTQKVENKETVINFNFNIENVNDSSPSDIDKFCRTVTDKIMQTINRKKEVFA